ncbi:TPA: hypothetical protein DF272_00340 [Candidatus Falkowbacteria bacterium]|nr:hypothetical protein [Candidatus Falkowbacteria bacterium]
MSMTDFLEITKRRFHQLQNTPVPGPADILETLGCELWLLTACNALAASPLLARRIAALGMLQRLWSPTSRHERCLMLHVSSEHSLVLTLKENLALIPTPAWETVIAHADNEIALLADQYHNLCHCLGSENPTVVESLLLAAIRRRDEIQSMITALRLAQKPITTLIESLEPLDNQFKPLTDNFHSLNFSKSVSDHLNAVSWCEPESWWGLINDQLIGSDAFDPNDTTGESHD